MKNPLRHFSFVILSSFVIGHSSLATPVMFPIAPMFGGGPARPFTLTAQHPALTDGVWLYEGTSLNVMPSGGTNPVVEMTPNNYLLTFSDARAPQRFGVPLSTNVLNVLNLITNGLLTLTNWSGGGGLPENVVTNDADGNVMILGDLSLNPGDGMINGVVEIDGAPDPGGPGLTIRNGTGGELDSGLNGFWYFGTPVQLTGGVNIGNGLPPLLIYPHTSGTNAFWSTQP